MGATWRRPTDGMEMVFVPGGEFWMGSDGYTEKGVFVQEPYERPVHTVALSPFWLDRTEVTVGQYRLCLEAGACLPSDHNYVSKLNDENQPMVRVNRHFAGIYCQWAGARLPTEAEWEYAARGPEARHYPWGDHFDPKRANTAEAGDGYEYAAPVGSYPEGASWCGALDMAGNVSEWVADQWSLYTSETQRNPTGPVPGPGSGDEIAQTRGGAFIHPAYGVRSAYRFATPRINSYDAVGFRCSARNP